MPTPRDVNVPGMEQVRGHRIPIDSPLLGDNPKVLAMRAELAMKHFFPPQPDKPDASPLESESVPTKAATSDTASLVALLKMVFEWLCMRYTKEA